MTRILLLHAELGSGHRSAAEALAVALEGYAGVEGHIPEWLTGTLFRNGPARFELGARGVAHWFDGLAMLHAFTFDRARVSYSNRFLHTTTYKSARAHGTLNASAFTADPCKSLFSRLFTVLLPYQLDNANVGIAQVAGRIAAAAEARFGPGARPAAIVLTHGHFDHVGAVATLARRWEVPVYAHALEVPYLTGRAWYPPADPMAGEGAMAWLAPLYPRWPIDLSGRVRALAADGRLPHLPAWQVVHTPGHTPGHISLFRADDGVLIAGDAVVTTRQETARGALAQPPEVRRPPAYFTPDWPAAQRSLEQVAALRPTALASGHGPTLRGPAMEEQLAHLARSFAVVAIPRRGRYGPPVRDDEPAQGRLPAGAAGMAAGAAATLPMTAVMLVLGKLAAREQRHPFPPRVITAEVTERAGVWQRADEEERTALTIAGHFGYGAALGAAYGARPVERLLPGPVGGAAYGLLVWAASYAGWLPAAGIMRPAWREAGGRNLQMIAAHLVWGATLGWLMGKRGNLVSPRPS